MDEFAQAYGWNEPLIPCPDFETLTDPDPQRTGPPRKKHKVSSNPHSNFWHEESDLCIVSRMQYVSARPRIKHICIVAKQRVSWCEYSTMKHNGDNLDHLYVFYNLSHNKTQDDLNKEAHDEWEARIDTFYRRKNLKMKSLTHDSRFHFCEQCKSENLDRELLSLIADLPIPKDYMPNKK
jgi:hypothetical protein